eukprot:4105976-Alexandrium_andersonii.AAC.1
MEALCAEGTAANNGCCSVRLASRAGRSCDAAPQMHRWRRGDRVSPLAPLPEARGHWRWWSASPA